MNARSLITSSLRTVGVIASGETPSASDMQDGLSALNAMIELWSTQNLALFELKREVFALVANKGDYTVGIGADFDTAKPMVVVGAAYGTLIKTPIFEDVEVPGIPTEEDPDPEPTIESQIVGYALSSDFEIPMEVLQYQQWIGISLKQTLSSIPTQVYVHGDSPAEKLSFWPVPSEECGFVLYSRKELSQFPDLDEEVTLPPGYIEAIKYNLAIRLCPEYGRDPSALVMKLANESFAKIKVKNSRVPSMANDVCAPARGNKLSNILSGGG